MGLILRPDPFSFPASFKLLPVGICFEQSQLGGLSPRMVEHAIHFDYTVLSRF